MFVLGEVEVNVLVTGGAGYIGSHTVRELIKAGHRVVVLDNLSKGHEESVLEAEMVRGDTSDRVLLDSIFARYRVEAVVHFAASSLVGESMADPAVYYHNNVTKGLVLLDAIIKNDIRHVVFSSTAAVYGEPQAVPITESHPTLPTNPYGATKLAFENALFWYDRAYGLRSVSLRYFNAAGADPAGDIGEDHEPETHLVPLVLKVASNLLPSLDVFGTDYPTPDGTCIRDYVHVTDLAVAHVLALEALVAGMPSTVYNLGNGSGYSVLEVIRMAEEVTGRPVAVDYTGRRPGDPAVLVAGAEKIKTELGWRPRFCDLRTIIKTAWQWHCKHPYGFKEKARR